MFTAEYYFALAMLAETADGNTRQQVLDVLQDGATAIEPEPVDFVLDRPFCFVITAPDSSILFAGIINNVGE